MQKRQTRRQRLKAGPRETVREAAAFFLEQVLLHADADSYRVLGATREASYAELRRNMTLLLQWLHPDLDRREARSVFAARVTRAWNDLKTPERRAAYDRAQHLAWPRNRPYTRCVRRKRHSRTLRRYVHSQAVAGMQVCDSPPIHTPDFCEGLSFCCLVSSSIGSSGLEDFRRARA